MRQSQGTVDYPQLSAWESAEARPKQSTGLPAQALQSGGTASVAVPEQKKLRSAEAMARPSRTLTHRNGREARLPIFCARRAVCCFRVCNTPWGGWTAGSPIWLVRPKCHFWPFFGTSVGTYVFVCNKGTQSHFFCLLGFFSEFFLPFMCVLCFSSWLFFNYRMHNIESVFRCVFM